MPEERLAAIEQKIDALYASVEKMRQYFLWTLVVTIAVVVLPAIGLLFAVPSFISTYTGAMESLEMEGL